MEVELLGVVKNHRRRGVVGGGDEVALDDGAGSGEGRVREGEPSAGEGVEEEEAGIIREEEMGAGWAEEAVGGRGGDHGADGARREREEGEGCGGGVTGMGGAGAGEKPGEEGRREGGGRAPSTADGAEA